MKEETTNEKSIVILDEQLKKLWKHAVTISLDPDNNFPAYKIYYLLIRKKIIEKHLKITEGEITNDEENLYD